jgi:hypothetical protein
MDFLPVPANHSFPSSSVHAFLPGKPPAWFFTTMAILVSLLILEQVVYRYKKRHLPGASWTIPLIGKVVDSVSPTMEAYKKQWDSGPLSALSVFNMYLFQYVIYPSQSPDPIFLLASLSWLPQMNFLVRSSIPLLSPNLVLCMRLSRYFVPITGKMKFLSKIPATL